MSKHNVVHLLGADRLFDGTGHTMENGAVAWCDGKIIAVGPWLDLCNSLAPASTRYMPGCTLLPGLVDLHTHLIMPGTGVDMMQWSAEPDTVLLLTALNNCTLALRSGITTLVDLGARGTLTFDLRHALQKTGAAAPRLLLCGRALTITGGHAWPWHGEADGIDGVRQAVRQLCKEGADIIKVMVSGGGTPGTDGKRPSFTQSELNALVDEAHARNRRVIGHCTATVAIERALNAGIDIIAHAQFLAPNGDWHVDARLIDRMIEQRVIVNPTLQINRILASSRVNTAAMHPAQRLRHEAWIARYPDFERSFLQMAQAGVPMVCGTDCGWGYSTFDEIHLEIDAMVSAGLSPIDALTSATGGAADALGWGDRIGKLAPGFEADILLVTGDPTTSPSALAAVRSVWTGGHNRFTAPCTDVLTPPVSIQE